MNTPPTDTTEPIETPEQKELRELERQIREQRERSTALDNRALLRRRRAELAAAKRVADDKETLTALEEEHGELGKKIAYAVTDRGLVVVKRAAGVVWNRWQNSKRKDADHEQFVRSCRIHPTEDEFDAIVDEQPGVIISLAAKLTDLYGARQEEDSGK